MLAQAEAATDRRYEERPFFPGGYKLTPLYDVMSVAPYPEFSPHKIKLAMSLGNKGYYRLKQIQIRHFYQTGQKAGLRKQDMDDIFSDLVEQIDGAMEKVAVLAADVGMHESTVEPILAAVNKRLEIIQRA